MSAVSDNNCTVCGGSVSVRKLRKSGIPACEACKKFFVRNYSVELHCVAGDSRCVENRDAEQKTSTDEHNENAATKRDVSCPKCRFSKCAEVGMRLPKPSPCKRQSESFISHFQPLPSVANRDSVSSTSTVNESPTTTTSNTDNGNDSLSDDSRSNPTLPSILQNPPAQESSIAEKSLAQVASNITILQQLPFIPVEFSDASSPHAVTAGLIEHTNIVMSICATFVKQLPGFSQLSMEDRRQLFKMTYLPMALSQSTQPNIIASPFCGFDEFTQNVMVHHFPKLKEMTDLASEIAELMRLWKPSFAEFALLQAVIFYQYNPKMAYLRPDVVQAMNQSMMFAMNSSIYSAGDINPENRWVLFMRVLKLFNRVAERFAEIAVDFTMQSSEILSRYPIVREAFSR